MLYFRRALILALLTLTSQIAWGDEAFEPQLNQVRAVGVELSASSAKRGLLPKVNVGLKRSFSRPSVQGEPNRINHALEVLGARAFLFDVYPDTRGGRYARRGALAAPGFKIARREGGDLGCVALMRCLDIMREWSIANPGHFPIFVFLRPHDDRRWFTEEVMDRTRLELLDLEVRTVLGEKRRLTQTDIVEARKKIGQEPDPTAWPELRQVRGKFVFALADRGGVSARYAELFGARSGVIFPNLAPGQAGSAILFRDAEWQGGLAEAAEQGYLIATMGAFSGAHVYFDAEALNRRGEGAGQMVSRCHPLTSAGLCQQ